MSRLQKEILLIYKIFKKICDENDLQYFAHGGTALGAVRHQGFIPWDDDMDILMPRPDYEKFLKIAPKNIPSNMGLYMFVETNMKPYFSFCKLHNKNTAYIERKNIIYNKPDNFTGIFLDIMPIDGLPDTKIEEHYNKLSVIEYGKDWKKLATAYPFDKAKKVTHIGPKRHRWENVWFSEFRDFPFEDTSIRIPIGYKEYLKEKFGSDYMDLPPKAQRTPVHEAVIDYDYSYTYYTHVYKKICVFIVEELARKESQVAEKDKQIQETNVEREKEKNDLDKKIKDLVSGNDQINNEIIDILNSKTFKTGAIILAPAKFICRIISKVNHG